MNKILKFRIWHKEFKRWLNSDEWCINFNGKLCFIDLKGITEDYLVECNKESYVIQQFTGLFDKNNKEIYEGDIIKVGSHKYKPWNVYWENEYSCFEPLTDMIFDGCKQKDFKIIGNIFEKEKTS